MAKARRPSTNVRVDPGSLLDFVPKLQPRYERPDHLAPLADLLERAHSGGLRAVVSVPPRMGKTELIITFFAWALSSKPWLQFMYLTYGGRLAESKSGKARTLARHAGVILDESTTSKKEWLTPEHGGLRASGLDQSVTGQGANVLIVDDPHKNRVEAESKAMRDQAWDLVTGTAETRMEPDGSIIICAQRWHEDDVAGRALATGEFTHINLKAINDDGTSLWARWSTEELARKRRIIGEYNWASQYEGKPAPRGGRLFFDALLVDEIPAELVVAIGVDLSHTARTSSDWCVAAAMGLDRRTGRMYVLDVRRRQARLADVMRAGKILDYGFARDIAELQGLYPGARTVMHVGGREDVILELMAMLKDSPVWIEALPAISDKWIRHQAYGAAWNRGEVGVPRRALWANQYVSEHTGFTGKDGEEDDDVDAGGAAYTALAEGGPAPPDPGGHERLTAGLRRTRWT